MLDLESGKIKDFIKFDVGNLAMCTGGHNNGRVGTIVHKEKHKGSFDIVHIKDAGEERGWGGGWGGACTGHGRQRGRAGTGGTKERWSALPAQVAAGGETESCAACSAVCCRLPPWHQPGVPCFPCPAAGHTFATRMTNVFVIGKGDKPMISLPKGKGIRQSILQEQAKIYGKTA